MSNSNPLQLTLAVAKYDRTLPILDGSVQPEGIMLKTVSGWIGDFCIRPVYEEYDMAEMSLSWYVMARCRQEPVVALPIFPLRMPVHAYLFCRSDAPYTQPRDLVGKRVGSSRYRYTVNLWVRGILEEYYDVSPQELSWITAEEEGAGFALPLGISVKLLPGRNMEELLLSGEIDCLLSPSVPKTFQQGDPRIRRLFPNCRAEVEKYFRSTGILPITHTLVMGEALWKREPWVAERMMTVFREAQRQVEDFYYADPKHLTLPGALFALEEDRTAFGCDPWTHGLEPNRHVLETFVRYAHQQGYIARQPALEELFAENTLTL
jgi:4,5-dihydroxyphthalate decarboxylase